MLVALVDVVFVLSELKTNLTEAMSARTMLKSSFPKVSVTFDVMAALI
jgi:hypothetical protein